MKIICIDHNYIIPCGEPYSSRTVNEPCVSMKPDTALRRNRHPFFIPDFSTDIRFGIEIVVNIDRLGKNIARRFGSRYYNEISAGVSATACDILHRLRQDGRPWEISNAFDNSTVAGEFIPLSGIPSGTGNIDFRLDADGYTVQSGNTGNMILTIDEIIEYASRYFTLRTGDLIFTGTPAATVRLDAGTLVEGYIADRKVLEFRIK